MIGNVSDLHFEMDQLSKCLTFGKANFSNTFRFLGINRVQAEDGRLYDHMKPYIQTMLADYKRSLGMNPTQPLRKWPPVLSDPFQEQQASWKWSESPPRLLALFSWKSGG